MDTPVETAAARSRATLIEAVTIAFLTIAFTAILARTWVRAVMTWNYGLDDVVMTFAMVCGRIDCILRAGTVLTQRTFEAHIHDICHFQPGTCVMGFWQFAYCVGRLGFRGQSCFGMSTR